MTSSCILGSVRLKRVENPNFFVFNPICLKFGIGGNFEMLITKSNPKLRLENDLSRKMQFSTDFSQNFTEHPSTIALPWQQWMSHGNSLYSGFKPILYSKSQKVSASYCLPFQHSRGKNQPVGGFRPPPACLGLRTFLYMCCLQILLLVNVFMPYKR